MRFSNPPISTAGSGLLMLAMLCPSADTMADPVEKGPDPVHVESPKFAAAWSRGGVETRAATLEDPGDPQPVEGFRLEDVTIASLGSKVFVTGTYRPGADDGELVFDRERSDFEEEVAARAADGRCLSGFEMRSAEGGVRYSGVFQGPCPASSPDVLETDLALTAFDQRHGELAPTHRLVDLETVVVDGQLRVAALWKPGSAGEEWTVLGVTWETFDELAHQAKSDGYELVDLDVQAKPWDDLLPWPSGPEKLSSGAAEPRSGSSRRPSGFGAPPGISWCESPGRVVFSGLWRLGGDRVDWLGVGYHQSGLQCAVQMLGAGHGESGVGGKGQGICDDDPPPPLEGAEPLRLRAVESYFGAELQLALLAKLGVNIGQGPIFNHGVPLHDSGTVDPP